jgi:hypothetical protein
MRKVLLILISIFTIGCSNDETARKIAELKQMEVLVKRVNDTNQVCNSMKVELDKLKTKINSPLSGLPSSTEILYKQKLPEIYLQYSSEYLKNCSISNK